MTQKNTIDKIYVGLRDAVIAEVGSCDFTECGFSKKECKYYIQGFGSANYDPLVFSNKRDLKDAIREITEANPNCAITWL